VQRSPRAAASLSIADSVRIAYDGVPLVGQRTGIGYYTEHLIRAVARADPSARCVVVYPWPIKSWRPVPLPSFDDPNIEVPRPALWTRLYRRVRDEVGVPVPLEGLIGPVDVFHGTNFLLAHPVRRAKRVVSIHDLTAMLFPEWHPAARLRQMRAGLRASAEAADRLIAVSRFTKNDVVKHLAVDPDRVAVVPLAVDPSLRPRPPDEIDTALAPLGLAHGSYLLFLGTMEPRKNIGRLLDAVIAAGPDVGPLVLAGSEGWGNEELRPRIADLARRGRVRAIGYVSETLRASLLGGARALVYPSLYEGFGLPPLEAMACGTPVITSGVSSLPEVVGDASLLINPLDVDELAGAIKRVWHDEALRADLRARGLARARQFTWDVTARLTLDAYAAALRS
jgi:glycosyltransferase involved in cell wall biosynthesis